MPSPLSSPGGGEGRGHIMAAARLQFLIIAIIERFQTGVFSRYELTAVYNLARKFLPHRP